MNFKDNTEEAAFRTEVRDFIKNEVKSDEQMEDMRARDVPRRVRAPEGPARRSSRRRAGSRRPGRRSTAAPASP